MPGILDYSKIIQTFGQWSTSEWRDMLLGRNLPPPIPEAIKGSKFATLVSDRGNIINVDDVGGENIRAVYELNKKDGRLLVENSDYEREIQNLNNRYKPLNGYPNYEVIYTPYLNAIAASLTLIGRGGATDVNRIAYPDNSNTDKFGLLSRGDEAGVSFPYDTIESAKLYNLNSESLLGLTGAKYLEEGIGHKIAWVEKENNPNTDSVGSITPVADPDTAVPQYIDLLTGFGYLNPKNLTENSVGWQEYNSSPKKNKDVSLMNRINMDLGNYSNPTLSTEERMNSLLTRTSDTQVGFLLNALGMNPFVPNYTDRRLIGTDEEGTNSRYYIGSKRNTNRGAPVTQQFRSADFNDSGGSDDEQAASGQKRTTVDEKFKWEKETPNDFNEKTILYETQNLATENNDEVWIDQTDKFFKDRVKDRLISRGNAISKQEFIDADFNGNYCRVWTVTDQYAYRNAIRNTGLFTDKDGAHFVSSEKASLSVLGDNGIVKSHPTKEDSETTFKKYMFSLENLAWADNLADLPLSEIGPGDLLSANKGRIMWFPPYDLAFDENVNATWTATEFIGRGEPLYTYNNAKRSGQLRFKMIVDHPRVINGYRGKRSNAIERFFAGCLSPDDFINILDKNAGVSRQTKDQIKNKLNGIQNQKKSNTGKTKKTYIILFDPGGTQPGSITKQQPDLFASVPCDTCKLEPSVLEEIVDAALKKKKVKITCTGFVGATEYFPLKSGPHKGDMDPNTVSASRAKEEGKKRAKTVYSLIEASLVGQNESARKFIKKSIQSKGKSLSTTTLDPNNSRVEVIIENDSFDPIITDHEPEKGLGNLTFYPEQAQLIDSMIINETKYFDFIDLHYPTYFANISEKIKYFQPGFHSTTPEGLNTRMNFLQQCMRQGPSVNSDAKDNKVKPQNLSFGRPPVLIIRVGDFFYSKIVCNSLNITYEGSGNIQWDLNPSGIGVQPMVANVTMSIDIIGGQSLQGPLNRLQNAVSFNYYANTEMYDHRSETIKLTEDGAEIVPGADLGGLKKDALAGIGGVDELTRSLKGEGILNQEKMNQEAAEAKDFENNYGIFISKKGTSIIVTSTTDKTGESGTETLPSEMRGNAGSQTGEKLVNNLLAIEATAKFRKGDTFPKNIYKEKLNVKSVDITDQGALQGINNLLVFNKMDTASSKKEITRQEELILYYNVLINGAIPLLKDPNEKDKAALLRDLKKNEKKLKVAEKKLEKLEASSIVDIEVTAAYTEDKKGSLKRGQFVWDGTTLKNLTETPK